MGLFSDIISTIGNGVSDVFGGGDNNDQKKKQQQQQAPQAPAPSFNNGPVKLPAVFQQAQQQQQSNPLQLFHPANQQPNPLQPQQPPADAPKIATASYAPPAQHQSLFSHLLHGAEDVGEGAASVGAGAALGTLRVGEGLVQSVGELPNDVTHLGTLGLNKAGVISDQTRTNVNNDVNGATNTVLSPVNWLANKTDEATGMFNHENGDPTITGKLIHDIYTPAQVAANIATVAPGIAAVAPKIAALAGDTGKIGDVIDAVKGFTDAQSATPTLSKVPILGSVIDHIPGLGGKPTDDDTAGATGDKAPVESGTKAPGEPSNAPAGEKNAPPEKAPGAVETGVKPPAAAPEEAGVPAISPAQAASIKAAESPTQAAVDAVPALEKDVPNYTSPVRNNKTVSVPGTNSVKYTTGDDNLDGIVHDSIVATKGTAATAPDRVTALDDAGISPADAKQIRDIAVKNVDKNTGKITPSAVQQIKDILTKPDEAPKAPSEPVPVTTPAEKPEAPATPADTPKPTATPMSANEVKEALKDTGNKLTNFQNVAQVIHSRIENGAGDLNLRQHARNLLDRFNARMGGTSKLTSAFHKALDGVLTKDQQANVQEALQSGTVDKLTGDEKAVAQTIQEHIHDPADTLRSSTDDQYVKGNNYSTQERKGATLREAAHDAMQKPSISGKAQTFNDLLQNKSHYSEGRTAGQFTDSAGNAVYGDANKLGLKSTGDGSTYVDGNGKTYDFTHASNQTLSDKAGMKFNDFGTSLHNYVNDTLNLKDRTDAADEMIKNPEKYGLSAKATGNDQPSVMLKGSDGETKEMFTDKSTQKAIQQSGVARGGVVDHTNLATTLFNKATTGVVQTIVANPVVHGANQLVQGMIASGLNKNGIGGISFLKDSFGHDAADGINAADAGVHFPTYGKDIQTTLSRATHGLSKLNEKGISAIDGNFRVGAFKSLTDGGMPADEAAQKVNQYMGDRNVFKNAGPDITMFTKYLKTEFTSGGRTIGAAFQGHPGALANAIGAAAVTYGLQKGFQDVTGNQNASIHAPGMVGAAEDTYKLADGLATGKGLTEAKNVATSHINPLVSQMAEQALNSDGYGNKIPGSTGGSIPSELAARGKFAAASVPGMNLLVNDGHSAAEKLMNTFGIYTPHIKGDMAAKPGSVAGDILNVKGAQSGATLAFPKGFNGEQEQKVVNGLGNNYTTKSAAILGTQTQGQQQKYVQSVNTLKKYGVTDQADIENFFKLSTKDQGSYVDAIDALNKAGTAVSSASVETQLVENGKTDLAASIDKSIPNSLSPQDKEALVTYNTKGSDGQKNVWLQNNDNASNYYQAVINQKNAQGALTTDDTDTGTVYSGSGGSLYTKYLVAQTDKQNNVPQSTVELYSNTTKTEYDNMSGSQKDTLTAYAQQLNKNGVIDKFGLATGSGGSGGSSGGSSAYSVDKAAGLPYGTISESFVKPTSDPGIKASSPLAFKAPTLLKYTPDEKSNPYTRSISVKAGVK